MGKVVVPMGVLLDGTGPDPRKVPVIQRREYTVYIEYIPHQLDRTHWLHMDVHRWSASVLKKIDKDFNTLLDLIGHEVRVLTEEHDYKLQKFVELLGFEFSGKVVMNQTGHTKRQYIAYPGRKIRTWAN